MTKHKRGGEGGMWEEISIYLEKDFVSALTKMSTRLKDMNQLPKDATQRDFIKHLVVIGSNALRSSLEKEETAHSLIVPVPIMPKKELLDEAAYSGRRTVARSSQYPVSQR